MTVNESVNVAENYVILAHNYKTMRRRARNAWNLCVKYRKSGGHVKIVTIMHVLNVKGTKKVYALFPISYNINNSMQISKNRNEKNHK